MNIDNKILGLIAALVLAIVFSWIPWLAYSIVASVITILPALEWMPITFWTWITLTLFFWYMEWMLH